MLTRHPQLVEAGLGSSLKIEAGRTHFRASESIHTKSDGSRPVLPGWLTSVGHVGVDHLIEE